MNTRDESYYFTLVTIQLDDCLFRVPRHRFEKHSEVFRNMFSMPPGCDSVREGGSDENPIHIAGVDKQSFKYFLEILYPPPTFSCPETEAPKDDKVRKGKKRKTSTRNLNVDKWLAILRLAQLWEFKEICDLTIADLERMTLPVVQKIEIAHKFGIQNWYIPAYKALVKRSEALSLEEATQLGFEFAIKLAGIRERWIARTSPRTSGNGVCKCHELGYALGYADEKALDEDIDATFNLHE